MPALVGAHLQEPTRVELEHLDMQRAHVGLLAAIDTVLVLQVEVASARLETAARGRGTDGGLTKVVQRDRLAGIRKLDGVWNSARMRPPGQQRRTSQVGRQSERRG